MRGCLLENVKLYRANTTEKKPISNRSRNQEMYEEIRRRICMLEFPPGMIVRETELATEFGLSRTPVREVLHQLKFEGLVETRNGVGTFVTGVDIKSFSDGYDLRIEFASLIGKLSPKQCEPEHVEAVKQLKERCEGLGENGRAEDFWSINHDLHEFINSIIGNRELAYLHSLYYYKVSRFWYQLAKDNWYREVQMLQSELNEILEAIQSGDMAAVGYVHRNHISFGKVRIGQFISNRSGGIEY